jgi:hypothetical protein
MRMKVIILAAIVFALSQESNAYAYLDPGTGSMVLQAVIGALAAVAFAAKLFWGRMKKQFTKPPDSKGSSNSSAS